MILALDSSTAEGSVALVADGVAWRARTFLSPRGRGGALFEAIEEILAGAPEITRVVVGLGPGSYNGIRSAVAAGWGITVARGVALAGISSLLAFDDGEYFAVGDARRQQFFCARVAAGSFLEPPELLSQNQLLGRVAGRRVIASAPLEFLPGAEIRNPEATRLAILGAALEPCVDIPEPLYLKAAFITTPREDAGRPAARTP